MTTMQMMYRDNQTDITIILQVDARTRKERIWNQDERDAREKLLELGLERLYPHKGNSFSAGEEGYRDDRYIEGKNHFHIYRATPTQLARVMSYCNSNNIPCTPQIEAGIERILPHFQERIYVVAPSYAPQRDETQPSQL